MLLFIDKPKNIRIVRANVDPDGGGKREYLGVISKQALDVPAELQQQLNSDELKELTSVTDLYKQAAMSEQRAAFLNLPKTLREAMAYIESDAATEVEKRLVVGSVLEAVRAIRKTQKDED